MPAWKGGKKKDISQKGPSGVLYNVCIKIAKGSCNELSKGSVVKVEFFAMNANTTYQKNNSIQIMKPGGGNILLWGIFSYEGTGDIVFQG